MDVYQYFIQRAADVEALLTSEQLEYLRQRFAVVQYIVNTDELREIASQWNRPDLKFCLDLEFWFLGQRVAQLQRLNLERLLKVAAG